MYVSLQILRGAAAWSVVFAHIVQSYYMGDYSAPFWVAIKKFGDTGVDIFFVLSGFVMALTALKYSGQGMKYWLLRCLRIVPVYWFYTLLLLISFITLPTGTYLADWNWKSLIHSMFLLVPGENPYDKGVFPFLYVGWTLAYEMFFYLVLSVLLALKLKNSALWCMGILTVFAVAGMNYEFLGKGTLILLEFVAGMAIYLASKNYKFIKNPVFLLSAFVVTACLYFYYGYSLQTKMSIACVLVMVGLYVEPLCQKWEKYLHVLKCLGDYSYSTYLCHVIVLGWFYATLNPTHFSDGEHVLAVVAICVSVTILSWLSYKFIETGPMVNYLKKKINSVTG